MWHWRRPPARPSGAGSAEDGRGRPRLLRGHAGAFNEGLADHKAEQISWISYLGNAEFWETTLQNWQSEFLAVGSFAVLAIYLRQRGSPESKPVGAAHSDTGVGG